MARRVRIQYCNALYHVINRGNYRRAVFGTVGAAQAFEKAISEVCGRFAWRLHAYVIMPNHYHFALETPQPNLVEGMHWLQSTFSTRFNRLRSEQGHLFQGRYQALLIEDSAALVRVINYIHLNPVRAKLVPYLQCRAFRWSSLRQLVQRPRPQWLRSDRLLGQLGLEDSAASWSRYLDYLDHFAANPTEDERQQDCELCSGWAIGTEAWKRSLAREYSHLATVPDLNASEVREIKEHQWRQALAVVLSEAGKSHQDIDGDPAEVAWKIDVAIRLRQHAVPYRWIGETLKMGPLPSIRGHIFRHSKHRSA